MESDRPRIRPRRGITAKLNGCERETCSSVSDPQAGWDKFDQDDWRWGKEVLECDDGIEANRPLAMDPGPITPRLSGHLHPSFTVPVPSTCQVFCWSQNARQRLQKSACFRALREKCPLHNADIIGSA
jgi:hypothetical protein